MESYARDYAKALDKLTGRFDISQKILRHLSADETFNLPNYFEKFRDLKSNVERMKFVWADIERFQIEVPFKKDGKKDEFAIDKRETGNAFFKRSKYKEALQMYTESLMVAESKEMLSLAYANRSATLFQLKLYKESLEDIDRAFINGYSENRKPKLIKRRDKCLQQNDPKDVPYEPVPEIPDSEKNADIPCAKNCVKIKKNEKYGRYVVATKNIEVGEVISVEPIYTGLIHEESMYIYCHHCLKLCFNLIPCDVCSKTLYCSDTCKDEAFISYHKYECSVLLSLDLIQIDRPKRLGFKITLMATNEWNHETSTSDDIYRSDRFKEIINLNTHVEDRSVENLYVRTATACSVYYLITKYTNFIEEGSVDKDRFMETLLSMVLIIGTNTVGVNEFTPDASGVYNLNSIATAVYSFFTIFSHSCYPNIHRTYHGPLMVLRSTSTIKKGEQCFVEYGPNYVLYPKEFRQNFLRDHYFFRCTCEACKRLWPTFNNIHLPVEWRVQRFCVLKELDLVDVDIAKRCLPKILEKVRAAEACLAPSEAFLMKGLLGMCWDIFGNKRRI